MADPLTGEAYVAAAERAAVDLGASDAGRIYSADLLGVVLARVAKAILRAQSTEDVEAALQSVIDDEPMLRSLEPQTQVDIVMRCFDALSDAVARV